MMQNVLKPFTVEDAYAIQNEQVELYARKAFDEGGSEAEYQFRSDITAMKVNNANPKKADDVPRGMIIEMIYMRTKPQSEYIDYLLGHD